MPSCSSSRARDANSQLKGAGGRTWLNKVLFFLYKKSEGRTLGSSPVQGGVWPSQILNRKKKKKEPLHSQRLASISGTWSSKFQTLLCVHLRIFGKDWCQVSRTGGLTRVTKMAPGFSELLPSLAEMALRTETQEAETQAFL